jgi:hypothetical protein
VGVLVRRQSLFFREREYFLKYKLIVSKHLLSPLCSNHNVFVSLYFVYLVIKIFQCLQAFINYCIFGHFFPQISGDFPNVQDALYNATSRLRDHLFGITQNGGGTGPNGRLRDYGTNDHGLNIHSLSHSIDHLTLSRNSDRSSSPGVGAPKVFLFLSSGWFSFATYPLLLYNSI